MNIPIRILMEGSVVDELFPVWNTTELEWQNNPAIWNGSIPDIPVLDMFEDESLSIKTMVKDLKDPKKLFTSLSKSFTVPASKKNNKILKHNYNIDILNGLDGRELLPCRILLNNVTYDIGNLSVEGVNMSGGVANSYKVRYVGKLSELSRLIGQDKITNLDFTGYNIDTFIPSSEFNNNTASEIVFPLASRSDRMVFNSVTKDLGVDGVKNIAFIDNTSIVGNKYGIIDQDIVGAMKVSTILGRIASKYGVSFSDAFAQDYISDLYLWMHKTDKNRSGEQNSSSCQNLSYDSGSTTLTSLQFAADHWSYDPLTPTWLTYISVEGTWTGDATLLIKVDGVTKSSISVSGNESNRVLLSSQAGIITFEAESPNSVTIDLCVNVLQQHPNFGTYQSAVYDGTILVGSAGRFVINENLPTMKIMDFLGSLIKMFNLIVEVDSDLNIKGTHFDAYMNKGTIKDVSEWVDVDSYNINRPNLFSAMRFKFADPKVAMEVGYEKTNNKQYGELEYDLLGDTGVRLSGSEYELKLDNQRIPLEPLYDLNDSSDSGVIYTQFADLKGAEQATKPMFTYVSRVVNGSSLSYDRGGVVLSISNYIMASNIHTSSNVQPLTKNLGNVGLYFGDELNEYNYQNSLSGLGLFNSFYKGLTSMMFDEDKRSVVHKAYLPTSIIRNLSLADVLLINNAYHNINSIDTNFSTGVSTLDLTLVGRKRLIHFDNLSTTVSNTSTTEVLRVTYIAENGFIRSTNIPVGTSANIDSIGEILTYSHDERGSTSAPEDPADDTTAPAAITDLSLVSSNGVDSITVGWTEPVDNVAVTGYRIYLNQDFFTEITNDPTTQYTFTGLFQQTEYRIDVSAVDANGNEALKSNILDTYVQ